MVLILGLMVALETSDLALEDYTPHAWKITKWRAMIEPWSENRRLSYDIVSLAVWFWPAHERGERLLVKLCGRQMGQKFV